MAQGFKTGGRQKGTPNQNQAAMMAKLGTRSLVVSLF